MKTGELSKRLNVHPNTIRLWCAEYMSYLSPAIKQRSSKGNRELSEGDALVLATVAELRNKGYLHHQIIEALDNGQRVEALPEVATQEETETRQRIGLVPVSELHRALDRVRTLESEIERLISERDKAQSDKDAVNAQIADLREEVGQLRGQIKERNFVLGFVLIVLMGLVVLAGIAMILIAQAGG